MSNRNEVSRRSFLGRGAVAGGVVVLGAGAGAALAGCSSGSSSGSGGNSGSSGSSGSTGTNAGIDTTNPKHGGSLTFGTFSEIDGFYPPSNHFDTTGYLYALSVYDPLFWPSAEGKATPYLAESISPDSTYENWTMKLRPGIKFSDGSDLTATVVEANTQALKKSPLTGPALTALSGITVVDGLTVRMELNTPYPNYPFALTTQLGFVTGQAMVDAFAAGKTVNPIGTGPFVYSTWQPNSHFTATKNPNYWRKGYPYLDQVTFKPIPDTTQREQSLRSGSIDIMVSADARTVSDFEGETSQYPLVDSVGATTVGEPTLGFIMLNCASPPTDDVRIRKALAMATQQEQIRTITKNPVHTNVTGIFLPNSKYYSASGYPKYNPAGAKQLVSQYKADKGTPKLQLMTVNDPIDQLVVQALQSMWQAVGFEVTIDIVQQATIIDNFVEGNFQAVTDTQFGAVDPALNYVWMSTTTISKNGSIGLNFARNDDPQLQTYLQKGRNLPDGPARIAAFQGVNRRLGEDVPYVWLGQNVYSAVATPRVKNFAGLTLPDGSKGYGFDEGILFPSQIWLS